MMNGIDDHNDTKVINNAGLNCIICVLQFSTQKALIDHRTSNDHRIKWINRKYRSGRKSFVGSKNDVTVEALSDDRNSFKFSDATSTIELTLDADVVKFIMKITNDSINSSFYLNGIDIINHVALIESSLALIIDDIHGIKDKRKIILLKPGRSYECQCEVKPTNFSGRTRIALIVQVEKVENGDIFYCGLDLVLKPIAMRNFGEYLPGVPLAMQGDELEKVLDLYQYRVPTDFQRVAFNNDREEIHNYFRPPISSTVTPDIHKHFFTALTWLEELQLQIDIQYYSKRGARLTRVFTNSFRINATWHELQIEGLAENRPCVMERDKVYVKSSSKNMSTVDSSQYYEGIVHKVLSNSVYLAFDPTVLYNYSASVFGKIME